MVASKYVCFGYPQIPYAHALIFYNIDVRVIWGVLQGRQHSHLNDEKLQHRCCGNCWITEAGGKFTNRLYKVETFFS